MKKISFILLALSSLFTASAQHRSTFDDLSLPANSYWNGSNGSGGILDGDAFFTNSYNSTYASWSGFSYSDVKVNPDTITSGAGDYNYQYSNASGSGVFGSNAYGLSYTGNNDATVRLKGFAGGHQLYGMYVTNSTYTYVSMKHGDGFAKKFGGASGTDPDWFRLTISGWYQGIMISNPIQVYLADFRSADTTQHYILKSWQFVNLQQLGNVDSVFFSLSSSDTAGGFGMNTPAYFAFDNFMTTDGVTYSTPIAINDSFSISYLDTLIGNVDTLTGNVLANDQVSTFLKNTVSIVSGPLIVGASAHIDANNNLVYVPAAGVVAADTVTYTVCDELGACSIAQAYIHVTDPFGTGIQDVNIADLHMYPNPATTNIGVSYSSTIETISIVDMSGREVLQKDVNRNSASLNIVSLSAGVYTVIIHTADGMAARRLIKE